MVTGIDIARRRTPRRPVVHFTAMALFDQSLDAEKSLAALQRDDVDAGTVSLILRDRASSSDRTSAPIGDVARALVASAMGPMGTWLQGLASLIVSERGTYLVAGLMGAALATLSVGQADHLDADAMPLPPSDEDDLGDLIDDDHDEADSIYQILLLFGVTEDDASYLESRLVAGASLVALTTSDRRLAAQARNEFDSQGAVYLRVVITAEEIVRLTRQRLAYLSAARSTGQIVVADAVAPLRRICSGSPGTPPVSACGRPLVGRDGEPVGSIEDILADPYLDDTDGTPRVRYAVVGHGGFWRIGRRFTAVPIGFVSLPDDGPAVLEVDRDVLKGAPRYERAGAFSRREELSVLAYFGVRPYWLDFVLDQQRIDGGDPLVDAPDPVTAGPGGRGRR